jgi:hypothetical protein
MKLCFSVPFAFKNESETAKFQ